MLSTYDDKYIPRELSWLSFNRRVLQEAQDPRTPLIERFRFLGIVSNNLDEFFRVRVGALRRLVLVDTERQYGHKPIDVLESISTTTIALQQEFEVVFTQLRQELEEHKVSFVTHSQISESHKAYLKHNFQDRLLNAISPIMLDQALTFPPLTDALVYLMVELRQKQDLFKTYALIEVSSDDFPRFISLPGDDGWQYLMILDDVMRVCLPEVFASLPVEVFDAYSFTLTRDAEMDVDNDVSQGLVAKITQGIKDRYKGQPVRFVYDQSMPQHMLDQLVIRLDLGIQDAYVGGGRYHNFKDFMRFPNLLGPGYVYAPLPSQPIPEFDRAVCMFDQIARRDMFLYYPYHSFSYYIRLLREAAIDPAVKAIRITLYRVASESKVVRALMNAARNGKHVIAVVELRARFDEEANLYWSGRMEEAGVHVVYGTPGLKVHAKMTHITRVEDGRIVDYATMSTGNFHEGNANVYTDFSLLTADPRITNEIEQVFNFIATPSNPPVCEYLMVAPVNMRQRLFEHIENEICHAKQGHEAYILIKVNNLVDKPLIDKLYEASNAGVSIKLAVRGMCSIIPGVEGLSSNIEAVSIVDRFLEHSRVFVFCNGGHPVCYMASADLMQRNMDHRVEIAVPVFDEQIKQFLIQMVHAMFRDNVKARRLNAKQDNRVYRVGESRVFRFQEELGYLLQQFSFS